MRILISSFAVLCGGLAAATGISAPQASAVPKSTPLASRQKVLAVVDLGTRPSDRDVITLSLQRSPSPVVSVRAVFFGATASLRRRDAGRRLGGAEIGLVRSDLRAPKKHPKSGIAVLIDDDNMRVSLRLGAKPVLNIRGSRPGATAEVKPGYSGVDLVFTTNAGRLVLAPKPGCRRSGARFDATLQDGSHITKTTWIGCPRPR